MMRGSVSDLHPLLPITFRLSHSPDLIIEFVVDTGFTGHMTLPERAVEALGLPVLHRIPSELADGSFIEIAVHEATILWQEKERPVTVLATGRRPLLGTALLEDCRLRIDFEEGGAVTIDEL